MCEYILEWVNRSPATAGIAVGLRGVARVEDNVVFRIQHFAFRGGFQAFPITRRIDNDNDNFIDKRIRRA